MELFKPTNYINQGRLPVVRGFGSQFNRHHFDFLSEHAVEEKRHNDLVTRLIPEFSEHASDQKIKKKNNQVIEDEYERIQKGRVSVKEKIDRDYGETNPQIYFRMTNN